MTIAHQQEHHATTPRGQPTTDEALRMLERRLARLERLLDEFCGAFLQAKFPFGRPVDRWSRR